MQLPSTNTVISQKKGHYREEEHNLRAKGNLLNVYQVSDVKTHNWEKEFHLVQAYHDVQITYGQMTQEGSNQIVGLG